MGVTAPTFEQADLTEAQIDAFVARNRDALNESIAQSRAEVAQGIYSKRTVAEIIADGRKRFETGENVSDPDQARARPTTRPANQELAGLRE